MRQIDSKVFVRRNKYKDAGVAQLVEHYLAKVDVEGSNPFARSNADVAQSVAHHFGKVEVPSSILGISTKHGP